MSPLSPPTTVVSSMRMYILRGAYYFFLASGILAMGYAGFVFADSHAYQALETKKFKQAGLLSEPHILWKAKRSAKFKCPAWASRPSLSKGTPPLT